MLCFLLAWALGGIGGQGAAVAVYLLLVYFSREEGGEQ